VEIALKTYVLPLPFVEPLMPYFIREKKVFMAAQAPGSRLDLPGQVISALGVEPDKFRGLSHADLMVKDLRGNPDDVLRKPE
jgi:hypothetical protein